MATNRKNARTGMRGNGDRPLTARETLFAYAVVRPGVSQTDAARIAGYLGEDATLATQASRLMRRPKVAALVEKLRGKQLEKLSEKAQAVLDELEHVGMARLSRVLQVHPALPGSVSIKPVEEWGEHERAALSKVKVEKIFEGKGENAVHVGDILSVEMREKKGALDTLAKHHKLVTDKVEHEHTGTVYVVGPYDDQPPPEGDE